MGSRENRILKVAKWRAHRMKNSDNTHAAYMCWSMEWMTLANECRISREDGYDQYILSLTPSLTALVLKEVAKTEKKRLPPLDLEKVAEFVESELKCQDDIKTLQRISRAQDPVAPADVSEVKTGKRTKSKNGKRNQEDSPANGVGDKTPGSSTNCKTCKKPGHKPDTCWFTHTSKAPKFFQEWFKTQSKDVQTCKKESTPPTRPPKAATKPSDTKPEYPHRNGYGTTKPHRFETRLAAGVTESDAEAKQRKEWETKQECYGCGKKGHIHRNCPTRVADQKANFEKKDKK
jgi:hypothetical protein